MPGLGGALTGVYAEELTPRSLFEAYKSRRIFATQGQKIAIDFRVGGLFMGQAGAVARPPAVTARIEAPDTIEYVEVVRDGDAIHRLEPASTEAELSLIDETAGGQSHFYFLRVKLAGDPSYNIDPRENSYAVFESTEGKYPFNFARARGPFAWSSPVWVEAGPHAGHRG